ncbi:hypothetical protein L195_g049435 [Trifolium pratense]|uniref:Uncharacterized protein n=1 Tax=Trifolium pratense TaxID=57577 RepID=A0A2K3JP50_TRIPR|nr:hypothetical protein L195_g049435 [Trifolium pratense]
MLRMLVGLGEIESQALPLFAISWKDNKYLKFADHLSHNHAFRNCHRRKSHKFNHKEDPRVIYLEGSYDMSVLSLYGKHMARHI